jgi:hypothetical protein
MQFQVPQFLDIEDKIIGPFTMKQFIYLIGGAGLGYMAQRFLTFFGIGYLIGLGFVALGATFAYYRPNKKPFADMVESGFNFFKSTRLYIWRRKEKKENPVHIDLDNFQSTGRASALPTSPIKGSKLDDLNWSIDVQSSSVEEPKKHTDSLVV